MEENKQEAPKTEPAPESEAAGELKRVRSTNKILKIATIIFSILFVLILGAALFIYQKVSAFRDLLLPPTETFQDSAFRAGEGPGAGGLPGTFGGLVSSTPSSGGSSLTVFTNAGEYAEGAVGGISAEDTERATRIIAKYQDRRIVKDFIAELKKDPAFAQALKEKGSNDPMAMIASIQKIKNVQSLMMKFITRRDFMPFMMEVMSDPDVKPLMEKMPGGGMGPMSQMLKSMPVAPRPRAAVPARAPAAPRPGESAVSEEDAEEPTPEIRVGDPRTSPEAPLKKKAPPPLTE